MEGVSLDKLEALFDLQVKYEQNEARKAYHVAMAEFKKETLTIEKDQHVQYKNVDYWHASLGNIVETVAPALGRVGLSASWDPLQDDKTLTVTCKLTHVLGHSESVSMSAPFDNTGGKNFIQAIGSANTYLQRYTFMAVTGQTAVDMDDDGRSAYENYQKESKGKQPTPTRYEWFHAQIDNFLSGPGEQQKATSQDVDDFINKKWPKEFASMTEDEQAKLKNQAAQIKQAIGDNQPAQQEDIPL